MGELEKKKTVHHGKEWDILAHRIIHTTVHYEKLLIVPKRLKVEEKPGEWKKESLSFWAKRMARGTAQNTGETLGACLHCRLFTNSVGSWCTGVVPVLRCHEFEGEYVEFFF